MALTTAATQRPGHWLLDLEIGGAVYRFADTALEVTEGSTTYEYASGLDDLEVTIGEGAPATSLALEPYAGGVAWAELISHGADPSAGTATLRRWHEGQDRAEAVVYVMGRVIEPEYGDTDEPFQFGVDSSRWESTETVPPSTARIDTTTWPVTTNAGGTGVPLTPAPEAIGAYYPWVYGCPGRSASMLWGTIAIDASATPAYVAEFGGGAHTYAYGSWLVAGHAVGATTARITDTSGGYAKYGEPSATLTISTMSDLRGRQVSVIVVGLGNTIQLQPGDEYHVTWDSSGAGGMQDPELSGAMRRAGAIIEDLFRTAGEQFDRGRFAPWRAKFDRLLLDFAIVEPVRPGDWVDEHLGSLLPVLRREGHAGVWYELWRYDATAADVEAYLCADVEPDDGIPVSRTSSVRWDDARDVENEVELKYLATRAGYAKQLRMVGDADPDTDLDEIGAYLCAVSHARYGRREATLTTDIIADDSTATLALQWRALWRTLARRSFTVEGGPELGVLQPNSVIAYTESGLYLDSALALVREVRIGLTRVVVELELLDRPDRRGRTA